MRLVIRPLVIKLVSCLVFTSKHNGLLEGIYLQSDNGKRHSLTTGHRKTALVDSLTSATHITASFPGKTQTTRAVFHVRGSDGSFTRTSLPFSRFIFDHAPFDEVATYSSIHAAISARSVVESGLLVSNDVN